MKRVLLMSVFLFLILFFPVYAEEMINDFSSEIRINQDSSIDVTETIAYDFGTESRHGIYRDIPYKYKARGGNFTLHFDNFSVTNENGEKQQFSVSSEGDIMRVKIGDPDLSVTGLKTYVLHYRAERVMNAFFDHDELYWNVTGSGWQVPITQAKAEIILPSDQPESDLKYECFIGAEGSGTACVSKRLNFTGAGQVDRIVFTNDQVNTGEGFTIVAGLPKGAVNMPSKLQIIWYTVKDNLILLLPFVVYVIMFCLWRKYGRDPLGRGTIIAEYDVPDNLTPAEVGMIVDERADQADISAEIIYLATKGYLKIKKIEGKGILKSADYEFTKLKEAGTADNKFDRKLMDALFDVTRETKKLSEMKNDFYKDLPEIKKSMYETITLKGYFEKNPDKVRNIFRTVGLLVMTICSYLVSSFGILPAIAVAVSGLIILVFGFLMPVKTKQGVLTKEYILGLKEYMSVVEKDRIKFHVGPNAPSFAEATAGKPEKTPAYFEKLLPYAMVLGVEKEWAKQFEGIYDNRQPSWYSDPAGGYFTAVALTNSLGSFQTKANSVLMSAPSSAAHGGSGFSGGGVGGGFGGGGGGSW